MIISLIILGIDIPQFEFLEIRVNARSNLNDWQFNKKIKELIDIDGRKMILDDGSWLMIRPSGTEPKMKVYIETFGGESLWQKIYDEALPLIFEIAR